MTNIKFENYSYFRIETSEYVMSALRKRFRYFVEGANFTKAYKERRWDGYKSFITKRNRMPLGTLESVCDFIKEKFKTEIIDIAPEYKNMWEEYDFLEDIELYSKGEVIKTRDNQWETVDKCIKNNRCVCVAPTSFGKSLVIYLLCLYHINYGRKVLIVCPKKILVDQMVADFKDYGYEGGINAIYTGQERVSNDITVITFQTLCKIPYLLEEFGCLILDECHMCKANSMLSIIDNAGNIQYKYGLTGSLKEGSIEYTFASTYIGKPHYITNTKTLIEEKVVAKLSVVIYRYVYPEAERVDVAYDYQAEKEFLRNCDHRYKAILEEAGSINKTGMIAAVEIEQAQRLYEMARYMFPDRNVYQIRGGHIECNEEMFKSFEEIKPRIELEKNAILIVGLKVFSTGVSVKNIHFGIMAVSTKSYTSVIQTIGRGLRVNKEKKDFLFIDWFDDFRQSKSSWTYMYGHLLSRLEIYKEQGFEVTYKTVGENHQPLLKL